MITIRDARKGSFISMEQAANYLGMEVEEYKRIEKKDSSNVTIAQAKKLSEKLGLPYDLIFFGRLSNKNRNYKLILSLNRECIFLKNLL